MSFLSDCLTNDRIVERQMQQNICCSVHEVPFCLSAVAKCPGAVVEASRTLFLTDACDCWMSQCHLAAVRLTIQECRSRASPPTAAEGPGHRKPGEFGVSYLLANPIVRMPKSRLHQRHPPSPRLHLVASWPRLEPSPDNESRTERRPQYGASAALWDPGMRFAAKRNHPDPYKYLQTCSSSTAGRVPRRPEGES